MKITIKNLKHLYLAVIFLFAFLMMTLSADAGKEGAPPESVTDLNNVSYEQHYILWMWVSPDNGWVMVYLDGEFISTNRGRGNQQYNATGLIANTSHTISTRTIDNKGYVNETWVNHTARTAPDPSPPAGVRNLTNVTYALTYINWTWTDPDDDDLSGILIYLDGSFRGEVPGGVQFYNATGLTCCTEYNLSTMTVDTSGNINQTHVYHRARTAPDNTPPVTNINLSGVKVNDWYASHVTVNLTADDDISGVNRTEYSLNGAGLIIYSAPFDISEEGETLIHYRSIDNAGNVELMRGEQVRIDTVPPQITVDNAEDGGRYNTNVTPVITITEPNIISRSITLNGEPFESGTMITDQGSYTLEIRATDIVDHVSVRIVNFTIDRIPPSVITGLNNATFNFDRIIWAWTDPVEPDFSHVIIYLDGVFQTNVPQGIQSYIATGLEPETEYEIGTRTVDTAGNINQFWVNRTARTAPGPPTIPCSPSCIWTVNYVVN